MGFSTSRLVFAHGGTHLCFYSLIFFTHELLFRPKEHHVFDILHYIKAAFKKHALDKINESDCFNKEAFR